MLNLSFWSVVKQEMKKPENYLSVVAYAGLTLTGLVSIRPIRRNYWIIFKFGHHVSTLLRQPAALLTTRTVWYTSSPGRSESSPLPPEI